MSRSVEIDRVVVVNDASTARGGATALALLSARLLREHGLAVTYFCGDAGDNPDLAALGVEVVALGHAALGKAQSAAALSGLYNTEAAAALAGWIRTNDTPRTVYHLHGWAQILSPSVFGPLSRVADRLILHAHDYFLACPNGAFFDYRTETVCTRTPLSVSCLATNCDKRRLSHKYWRVARQGLRRALMPLGRARIALIHEGMGPAFRRSGAPQDRLVVLRNPVAALRSRRSEAETNRTVLFIGRIQAEKGVEDAAEAARLAGAPLCIVGEGPLKSAIEQRYPEARVLPWQTADEIGRLLGEARVVVMPSRYPEPFGMVCLEAIGAGVPVVVPPGALLSGDIQAHGLGYVCDTRDIPAFAALLKAIAADDAGVAARSRSGFESLRSLSPSASQWGDRLIDLYAGTLQAAGAAA